jgi:hypothetical protein
VELAVMRDRSASRKYSPEGEAFRREHERHRAWGLTQRHAERLRRSRCRVRGGQILTAIGEGPGGSSQDPPTTSDRHAKRFAAAVPVPKSVLELQPEHEPQRESELDPGDKPQREPELHPPEAATRTGTGVGVGAAPEAQAAARAGTATTAQAATEARAAPGAQAPTGTGARAGAAPEAQAATGTGVAAAPEAEAATRARAAAEARAAAGGDAATRAGAAPRPRPPPRAAVGGRARSQLRRCRWSRLGKRRLDKWPDILGPHRSRPVLQAAEWPT